MIPKRSAAKRWTHASVQELLRSCGPNKDPEGLIRERARELVATVQTLGWDGPPYDMEVLASLVGYRPRFVDFLEDDQDACISATEMLVNANKAPVRQRFSIGHEIGHTLFPDFSRQVANGGPQWRRQRQPNSEVEHLCQVAASEFLMPYDAFIEASRSSEGNIATIIELSELFLASTEATAHRLVDLAPKKVIAVFAKMKWKPTEVASLQQTTLPLCDFQQLPPMKMRVLYATGSSQCGTIFLPPEKSLPDNSVAYEAWTRAAPSGAAPYIVSGEEDWSQIGKVGRCFVEAVALPLNSEVPSSVLCLIKPE